MQSGQRGGATTPPHAPLVVGINMGYGHLRAAQSLADPLGTQVLSMDEAPLADAAEQRLWHGSRRFYEFTSRVSQLPYLGRPWRALLDAVTHIPHLHPYRDQSAPNGAVRMLERAMRRGLGQRLVEHLRASGDALLTTFYAPAIVADRAGLERIFCVVTDADINRVWVGVSPERSRITYFVPSQRALRRLRAYGVPAEHIVFSGFPLPAELLGGPELATLRRHLALRLPRLDPRGAFREMSRDEIAQFLGVPPDAREPGPPRLTFAVGGAGAQANLAREFLPGFRDLLAAGRLRLTLVAGVRGEIAAAFRTWLAEAGLESQIGRHVEILVADTVEDYLRTFNARLADTDILWTKPSELVFYAALGIPLVLAPPVGHQEIYNRRWALEHGVALRQGNPRFAAQWITEWLQDGALAAAAWSGFTRAPKFGTYRIIERLSTTSEAPVPHQLSPDT
jgi:hypothetical protein